MIEDILKEMANHVEFFGYSVESLEGGRFGARHDKHWNFVFGLNAGGVLLRCYLNTRDDAPAEIMNAYVNDLNRDAAAARFYIDSDNDFVFEAWWPALYEKKAFGTFIEVWQRDGALIATHEASADLLA